MNPVERLAANLVAHERLCEHEAAHASAALAVGITPTEVYAEFPGVPLPDGEPPGQVLLPLLPADYPPEALRQRALVVLAGPLHEGRPGWPPRWPLTDAPGDQDERVLVVAAKALGLDRSGYAELVQAAYRLLGTGRFQRGAEAFAELLKRGHRLDRAAVQKVKAIVDDGDDDRDELGVISDRAVEEAVEQLRRDSSETSVAEAILDSPNGDGSKSVEDVREETYRWAFKAMSAARIEVAEFEVET